MLLSGVEVVGRDTPQYREVWAYAVEVSERKLKRGISSAVVRWQIE